MRARPTNPKTVEPGRLHSQTQLSARIFASEARTGEANYIPHLSPNGGASLSLPGTRVHNISDKRAQFASRVFSLAAGILYEKARNPYFVIKALDACTDRGNYSRERRHKLQKG